MTIRSAAKALVVHHGKLLLNQCKAKNGFRYYDLPGGGLKPFEALEETVCREVREETGYVVRVRRFAALTEEIQENEELRKTYPDHAHRVLHIFLTELQSETAYEKSEMDHQQSGSIWVSPPEADRLQLRPRSLRGMLSALIQAECPLYLGTVYENDREG